MDFDWFAVFFDCDTCGEPITDSRPGYWEAYSVRKGERCFPARGEEPNTAVWHQGCDPLAGAGYRVAIPTQLRYAGDPRQPFRSSASAARWLAQLQNEPWASNAVLASLADFRLAGEVL